MRTIPAIVTGTRPMSATSGCPGCSTPGSCTRPRSASNAHLGRRRSTRSSSRTRRSSSRGTSSRSSTRRSTRRSRLRRLLARTTKWTDLGGPARQAATSSARCVSSTGRSTPASLRGRTSGTRVLRSRARRRSSRRPTSIPTEKHAPIGPTVAVGDVGSDGTIWVHMHGQNPQALRGEIALMLNMPLDNVIVRWYDGSGHYGRSNGGNTGAEEEAVILSQIVGKPVRVQWMRWDDMQWSTQHPPVLSDLQAGLDASGKLVSFNANYYVPAGQDDRPVGALLAGLPTMTAPAVVPFRGKLLGSSSNSDLRSLGLRPGAERAPDGARDLAACGTNPNEPNFDTQIGLRGHSMRTPGSAAAELRSGIDDERARRRGRRSTRSSSGINNTSAAAADRGAQRRRRTASGLGDAALAEPECRVDHGIQAGHRPGLQRDAAVRLAYWACAVKVSVNPEDREDDGD